MIIRQGLKVLYKAKTMDKGLHITTIILIVVWAIFYFVFSAGAMIHVVLVLAVLVFLLSLLRANYPL